MRGSGSPPPVLRTLAVLVLTGLAPAFLVGCRADDGPPDDSAAGEEGVVLQPGGPGDAAATIGPDEIPEQPEWNHSDVAFVQMMIPHHAQALEMSRLALAHAGSDEVRALARRIQGAQGPEIVALAAWLQERDLEVPGAGDDPEDFDHGEHGHTAMAGMLSDEEMQRLDEARGQEFDRLFLKGMIAHHAGAVQMAEASGNDPGDIRVGEIVADVATGQTAEIKRMRVLLRDL